MTARDITKAQGGDWHGYYGLVPGPGHSRKDRSVKVMDGPDGEIIIHSFAGDDWKDIKVAWRAQGLLPDRQGTEQRDPRENEQRRRQARDRQRQRDAEERRKIATNIKEARATFKKGIPLADTIGEHFMRHRGLEGPYPASLRYVPSLIHPFDNLPFSAIVAAVQAADRSIQAIQCTYLLSDGSGKARLSRPRLNKGPIKGGTVRLAAAGEVLGLAEGVETGLSAMRMFNVPVWSCLGGFNIKNAPLPDIVRQVVIYGDAGDAGWRFAEQAAEVFVRQGRKVKLTFPVEPYGDFNDVAQAQQPEQAK